MDQVEPEDLGHTAHFPLAIYKSVKIGSVRAKDGQEFSVLAGLDKDLVAQLKEKSLDESDVEIQKNTSDRQRFGEGSYEDWYSKDRTPFALVHEQTKELAGLIWFGPKPLGRKSLKHLSEEERKQDERLMDAGDWHTIVYRSYNPFRGKGLMSAFGRLAIDVYLKEYPNAKLWAGIYADNPASLGYATKLGFRVLEEASDPASHETVMVWSGPSN